MQINRIECRLGATVNAGDFQSIKAEVMAQADIERNEDPIKAYAELAEFVRSSLVNGANAAHPDAVRNMLTHDARLSEAADGNKKAAAPKGKAATKKAEPKATDDTPKMADTADGMKVGNLDKETELDTAPAASEDNLDDLLGDAPVEPVTKEQLHEGLVKLNKKGGKGAVLEVLKTFGVANLSQIPEAKYGEALKLATEKTDAIAAAS